MLVTTWKTPSGWVLVRDALTIGPWDHEDAITPHTRPPADDDADHMLVRTVECIDGQRRGRAGLRAGLRLRPRLRRSGLPWTAVATPPTRAVPGSSFVSSRISRSGSRESGSGRVTCCSRVTGRSAPSPGPRTWSRRRPSTRRALRLKATTRFWRNWLSTARIPDHQLRDPIQRSALTIKGLTYMPTGATVAALTTSLPETPGGERNWDYRYTWIRDTTFTLQALHFLNLNWEAEEFMEFIADLEPTEDGSLQIMYGIDGRRDLTESTRDHLTGYAGARPVRVGNGAFDQRQNDVFGAVLDSILLHTRHGDRLPTRLWPIVQSQAECATNVWRQPDQGIWEARGKPQHYVSSKLMCWVALDRAAELAELRGDPEIQATWQKTADEIRADILEHGVRDGVLRQHYETDALDASNLLAAIFGFLPGSDETLRKSVEAIATDLTEDGFVLRYRTGETDDGLSGKEGTFLICSFWLVSALAVVGELQRARDLMERLLRVASPLGLYAEEFDAATGRHLGNFPQAFSHLALIEAAARLVVQRPRRGVLSMADYDVIIVGTGAGGGTLARHLAPSGKRILLLERGDWLPREPQNWLAQDVFVDNRYVSRGHLVRRAGQAVPAADPLLRRRRDEALRRSALPSARGGLRGAPAPRRSLAGLADHLRRDRALLHQGGAPLRGTRRSRRGPDRALRERSVPVPGRLARAADPAALRRSGRRRVPPLPCAVRDPAERSEHALQRVRALRELRRLPLCRPRQVGRGRARSAAGPRAFERRAASPTRRSSSSRRTPTAPR